MNPFYRRTGQAQRPIPRPAVKQDIANPKSSSSGMTKERASRRNSLGLWGLVFAKTTERGDGYGSIRAEHELAVAFEIGAGAHVELAVLADEEQGALRHFFGALQKQAGIVGAHLVGESLPFLVINVAGVGPELPRCGPRGLRPCRRCKSGAREQAQRERGNKHPCKSYHCHPSQPRRLHPLLNKSRTASFVQHYLNMMAARDH